MIDIFELGLKTSPLKLTDEDISLLNALLIINPSKLN